MIKVIKFNDSKYPTKYIDKGFDLAYFRPKGNNSCIRIENGKGLYEKLGFPPLKK